MALFAVVAVSCSGEATLEAADESAQEEPAAEPTPRSEQQPEPTAEPLPEADDPEPVPYVPAGRPGSAEAYSEMIDRLAADIPADLRSDVPWPDLRNPDPVVAQIEIFELWIWMAANYPEPELVEVMAAPGSPSREEIVGVFGALDRRNELERRTGQGYQAFDHLVVTFESSGLPLWLGRDVPEDAVVVYYSDNSGPTEVTDRDTGEVLTILPGVATRTWLSIMVPTDVGWQLWRDQLLDASNGLEVPDVPPPPGRSDQGRTPEV